MNEDDNSKLMDDQGSDSKRTRKSSLASGSKLSDGLLNYYQSIRDWVRYEHFGDPDLMSSSSHDDGESVAPLSNISSMSEHQIGLDSPQGADLDETLYQAGTDDKHNTDSRGIDGLRDGKNGTESSAEWASKNERKRSHNSVIAGRRGRDS